MSFPVAFALTICSLMVVSATVALWQIWRKRDE